MNMLIFLSRYTSGIWHSPPGVNTYQIIATILDYDGDIIAGCEGSTFIANGQSITIKPQDNEQ